MFNGEIIETRRGRYRRVCARAIDHHVVGIDIGKSADYTAICVVNQRARARLKSTSGNLVILDGV
jgi:hypothetical protein